MRRVDVRKYGTLTAAERREIELEENLHRKDLTPLKRSKTVKELAETAKETISTDSVKKETRGRKPKGSAPNRAAAEKTGIPEQTIRDAETHVAAAEKYPLLQGDDQEVSRSSSDRYRRSGCDRRGTNQQALSQSQRAMTLLRSQPPVTAGHAEMAALVPVAIAQELERLPTRNGALMANQLGVDGLGLLGHAAVTLGAGRGYSRPGDAFGVDVVLSLTSRLRETMEDAMPDWSVFSGAFIAVVFSMLANAWWRRRQARSFLRWWTEYLARELHGCVEGNAQAQKRAKEHLSHVRQHLKKGDVEEERKLRSEVGGFDFSPEYVPNVDAGALLADRSAVIPNSVLSEIVELQTIVAMLLRHADGANDAAWRVNQSERIDASYVRAVKQIIYGLERCTVLAGECEEGTRKLSAHSFIARS